MHTRPWCVLQQRCSSNTDSTARIVHHRNTEQLAYVRTRQNTSALDIPTGETIDTAQIRSPFALFRIVDKSQFEEETVIDFTCQILGFLSIRVDQDAQKGDFGSGQQAVCEIQARVVAREVDFVYWREGGQGGKGADW
jgi:hypothetical protein